MMEGRLSATGLVLAGGQGRRLGREKAIMPFGGQPLLTRTVERLRRVCAEVIIVGPPHLQAVAPDAQVEPDVFRGAGPLAGLHAGLGAASHPWCLAVACDMPFLNPGLLAYLLSLTADCDLVLPRHGGHTEQLHAAYAKACLPFIERQLAAGDHRVDRFFPHVRVRYVDEPELKQYDPDLLSFFNVNTPEALQQAQEILFARGEDRFLA